MSCYAADVVRDCRGIERLRLIGHPRQSPERARLARKARFVGPYKLVEALRALRATLQFLARDYLPPEPDGFAAAPEGVRPTRAACSALWCM